MSLKTLILCFSKETDQVSLQSYTLIFCFSLCWLGIPQGCRPRFHEPMRNLAAHWTYHKLQITIMYQRRIYGIVERLNVDCFSSNRTDCTGEKWICLVELELPALVFPSRLVVPQDQISHAGFTHREPIAHATVKRCRHMPPYPYNYKLFTLILLSGMNSLVSPNYRLSPCSNHRPTLPHRYCCGGGHCCGGGANLS